MTVSTADLILILRNVTGRVDNTDPQFTDEIMIGYLDRFIQLTSTQEIRLFKNYTWYEFPIDETTDNPFPVDLQTITMVNGTVGASTIGPLCYANGFPVFWYEAPQEFYAIWPESQPTYAPQRPTYVLYYNNSLTFRGPPDQTYQIKIQAYQVEIQLNGANGLNQDYLYRYVCYGAALDIFGDFGEIDRYNEVFPLFKRYRAHVTSRTNSQYQNQRPSPEF